MKPLFTEIINGVESWIEIYQSTSVFEPLIKGIFKKHRLKYTGTENLTPGSNAVFKVNNMVIKIFAPIEAGFTTGEAYHIEKQSLIHANNVITSVPKILFSGEINDKYRFQYIIMDYISGNDFNAKRNSYTKNQKKEFATCFKELTKSLNIGLHDKSIPTVTKEYCLNNDRWNVLSKKFREDRETIIRKISFDSYVYVHGDIKAANIIVDNNENIYVIDFADSHIAPLYYEWPFIVFGLFGCDPMMMDIYFGHYDNDLFYEMLTHGILIHKFGVGILMQICELSNTPLESVTNISSLKELLRDCIQTRHILIK